MKDQTSGVGSQDSLDWEHLIFHITTSHADYLECHASYFNMKMEIYVHHVHGHFQKLVLSVIEAQWNTSWNSHIYTLCSHHAQLVRKLSVLLTIADIPTRERVQDNTGMHCSCGHNHDTMQHTQSQCLARSPKRLPKGGSNRTNVHGMPSHQQKRLVKCEAWDIRIDLGSRITI